MKKIIAGSGSLFLLAGTVQSFAPIISTSISPMATTRSPPQPQSFCPITTSTSMFLSSEPKDNAKNKNNELVAIGFLMVGIVLAYNIAMGVTQVTSDVMSHTGQTMLEGSGKLGMAVLQGGGAVAGATVKTVAPVVGKALWGGGKLLWGGAQVVGEAASPYVQEAGKQLSEASAPLVQETTEKLDATVLQPLQEAASPYVQEASKQLNEVVGAPLQEVSKQVQDATAPLHEVSKQVTEASEKVLSAMPENIDAGAVGGAVLQGTGVVAGAAVQGVKLAAPVVGKALVGASHVVGEAASPYVQEASKQLSETPLVQETSEKLATSTQSLVDSVQQSLSTIGGGRE